MDLGARKRQAVSSKVTGRGEGRGDKQVCAGLGGKEEKEELEGWEMCRQEGN